MWRLSFVAGIVLSCVIATGAMAVPEVPADDNVVLERLPEKGNPALTQLKRMRAALAANPQQIEIAAPVARRAIEAARETGDPRFLGQAQAALAPWWSSNDAPEIALVLRATVKQSQHDFAGALADLDLVLKRNAANGQARLTRATVLTVQGRYEEAKRDCAALVGHALPIVVTACTAAPASLSGSASAAYASLAMELSRPAQDAGLREWAETLAAEIAWRRGARADGEAHFRNALTLDPRDPYLKAAFADFLLEEKRSREVITLLRDDIRNDSLFLRLALAEQRLPESRGDFDTHRTDLAARFEAACMRGDSLHRREEARFRLEIEHDPAGALTLAEANWAVQREPADLAILAAAAHAAGDARAMHVVDDWMATTKLEDLRLAMTIASSGRRAP